MKITKNNNMKFKTAKAGIETSQPRMIEIFEAAQNLSDL